MPIVRRSETVALALVAAASLLAAWVQSGSTTAGLIGPSWREGVSIAIPVTWACLFLYVPVRPIASWMWREVERAAPRIEDRRMLGVLLLLGVALMIWGLDWGLVDNGWAADELRPGLVQEIIERRLSDGWYDKYPLMHYAVLAIPVSAFKLAAYFSILPSGSLHSRVAQLALMRLVSVIMGLGTLVAAYLCGVEMYGARRAVLGALALLLTPLVVYYSKIANLDVPSLCWFGWTLLAFLRILRTNRTADYVRLGVAAAAAVATKDQAYANLALIPLAVAIANARHQPSRTWWKRLAAVAVDRRILAAGAATVVAFAVFNNLLFNADGFRSHLQVLTMFGEDLAIVPRTLAGYTALTITTVDLFKRALGWPLFIAAAIGIAGAVARKERRWWLWLLVVPLSFHLTFTWVTLYVCDRYLFGGVFVLALFSGAALSDLMEVSRSRPMARLVVGGSFAYSLLYAASINVMMNLDARNAARAWVYAHAGRDTRVGMVGFYLPALGPPVQTIILHADVDEVRAARPEMIILNARFARRFEVAEPEKREFMAALKDGALGYTEVFHYRAALPAWALLQYDPEFRGSRESDLTNLDKINPRMTIYRRDN